jgi:hypothetical protein
MLSLTVYGESIATVSQGCCGKCPVERGVNAYDLFSVPPRTARGQKRTAARVGFRNRNQVLTIEGN